MKSVHTWKTFSSLLKHFKRSGRLFSIYKYGSYKPSKKVPGLSLVQSESHVFYFQKSFVTKHFPFGFSISTGIRTRIENVNRKRFEKHPPKR